MNYEETYRRSIDEPEAFWGEAKRIHWHKPPQQVLDYSNPPFRRWFVGGETNLCYNAVDRHLAERADQLALVAISTETNSTREITYRQLYREVNDFAAVLKHLGVGHGDRVVIYMPNMAEAVFAMLARAHRRGAFGGVRWLCRAQPGTAHRRRQAQAADRRRRGHARWQADSVQADGRRRLRRSGVASATC